MTIPVSPSNQATRSLGGAWAVLAVHLLRESGLLQPLDAPLKEELVQALVAMGSYRVLAPEQTYQQHGDVVAHVSIVLTGYLLVGLVDALGKVHIVRPLGAGQPFNLLPVLDGGVAIHDARAGPETVLWLLPRQPFLQLMHSVPAFGTALHALLFARNRQLYQELADMALLPLRQRCARMILQVMEDRRTPGSSLPHWCVSVSQSELAEMLGYTRPIVNKALRGLADEGLIRITYRQIAVLDAGLLERVAVSGGAG
jgi:CRP/FNR family transcriptional regulator, cyclic AMP receptor protein